METTMPAGRRRVAPWLGSLRLFTKESGRRSNGSHFDQARPYGIAHVGYACVNHPKYRQILLSTIEEIFRRYQPAGLYVDGLTPHICYCEYCRARYRKTFGEEIPPKFEPREPETVLWEMSSVPQLVGDPSDPDSYKLTRHLNGGVDASFSRWLEPAGPVLVGNAVEWARQGQATCKVHSSVGRFTVRLYDQADCGPIGS
jgi:hypothetical protein